MRARGGGDFKEIRTDVHMSSQWLRQHAQDHTSSSQADPSMRSREWVQSTPLTKELLERTPTEERKFLSTIQ